MWVGGPGWSITVNASTVAGNWAQDHGGAWSGTTTLDP